MTTSSINLLGSLAGALGTDSLRLAVAGFRNRMSAALEN